MRAPISVEVNVLNCPFVPLVTVCSFAFLAGCGPRSEVRITAPTIAADAGRQAVAQYDRQNCGRIGGSDLARSPAIQSIAAQLDPQNSGGITAAAIDARIRSYREQNIGRMLTMFAVLHNGKPLSDAVITLVPEAFLGPNMQTGGGTTDSMGRTRPSIPLQGADRFPGMPCGFYRVQITKAGESIPSRYNTETTLGVEISADLVRPQPLFFPFDLQY
jgi:hypothetical protein